MVYDNLIDRLRLIKCKLFNKLYILLVKGMIYKYMVIVSI